MSSSRLRMNQCLSVGTSHCSDSRMSQMNKSDQEGKVLQERPENRIPFFLVDVFAEKPLEGNPVAVVPGAGHLPESTMHKIAREFNQSETNSCCLQQDLRQTGASDLSHQQERKRSAQDTTRWAHGGGWPRQGRSAWEIPGLALPRKLETAFWM
jgi:hypothetical protein